MIVKLLKDFVSELDDIKPVQDLEAIILNYIYSYVFIANLITLIPFTQIFSTWMFSEVFYVIKIYRMIFVLKYLKIKVMFKRIQDKLL